MEGKVFANKENLGARVYNAKTLFHYEQKKYH